MVYYLRVIWGHAFVDEPVLLLCEVTDGEETRKVEVYRDGHADLADRRRSTGSTRLSVSPLPSVEEISAQDEFTAERITRPEFDRAWLAALRGHRL
ncbi:MAG: hypothetical protein LBC97_10935 [Bifidobacteriaceae bacterium]|jgi:hypothetical protein|nr:hypothetical protein [Bifidobacteriaceae bacterium]